MTFIFKELVHDFHKKRTAVDTLSLFIAIWHL